jgi:hypothetical protein
MLTVADLRNPVAKKPAQSIQVDFNITEHDALEVLGHSNPELPVGPVA